MRTTLKYARKFIGKNTIRAASWELYKDDASGQKLCGCFKLAWKDSSIVIHSLDLEPNSVSLFYAKIMTIVEKMQDFMLHLGAGIVAVDRGWLNPLETGATGSFAYCIAEEPADMVYFELASCTSKVRIYRFDFDDNQDMLVALSQLRSLLIQLLKGMEELQPWSDK